MFFAAKQALTEQTKSAEASAAAITLLAAVTSVSSP